MDVLYAGGAIKSSGTGGSEKFVKNFYVVGNPTINENGVLSNITNKDYVKIPYPFLAGENSWEIVFRVKTPQILEDSTINKLCGQLPQCNFYTPQVELQTQNGVSHFWYGLDVGNYSGWSKASPNSSQFGKFEIKPNQLYTIKIRYAPSFYNSEFQCLVCDEEAGYEIIDQYFSYVGKQHLYTNDKKSIICVGCDQETADQQWRGEIYLKDCHIDIAGKRWFDFYKKE